jgi:hypothetical protein
VDAVGLFLGTPPFLESAVRNIGARHEAKRNVTRGEVESHFGPGPLLIVDGSTIALVSIDAHDEPIVLAVVVPGPFLRHR